MARLGLLPLARATFDVPFATETAARAFATLDAAGHAVVGRRDLLFDAAAAESALAALSGEALDALLILQVTFTDASMTVRIAEAATAPLALWAFPEPRSGGRLRLNSFCGLNLAAHALGRAGKVFGWLHADPDAAGIARDLEVLFRGAAAPAPAGSAGVPASRADRRAADALLDRLKGQCIGLVGEHPVGFDTCRYDGDELQRLSGVETRRIGLPALFERARAVPAERIAATRAALGQRISGLAEVDRAQLDRSLSIYHALEGLAQDERFAALAVRCWPEMFTEYGCAACGPMGLMNEARVPCACEADMYGAFTALALQEIAAAPSFLVDIVDIDPSTDTGVLWHCGLAPLSMADPATPPAAQVHANRRMPLLQEFALRPGRVTAARLSQARNETSLVIAGGRMLSAPKSFTGTSGVIRFDRPAGEVRAVMMDLALEHHLAIVYGDVRGPLRALGEAMGVPVVELA